MSSFDNGTLNVGTLGFPSSGYILGINATGGIYTTNTSNQSTLTIPLSTLTSLTTGTFIVGSTYPMTAVFSTTLPAVASVTINPPNSSDTIASASVSASTLTFNWTPVTAVTNSPFSFVFGIQTVQSANYTTYAYTPTTLTFLPTGIAQSSGNITSWTDTTSVAQYTVSSGVPTYNSTNNSINLGSGQSLSTTYNANLTLLASFAIKFLVTTVSNGLADYVMYGNNLGFEVSNGNVWVQHQDSSGITNIGSISENVWAILVVSYNGSTISYSLNNSTSSCSNANDYTNSLPNLGRNNTGTTCQIKEVMFWNNHVLSSTEMGAVYTYLSGM